MLVLAFANGRSIQFGRRANEWEDKTVTCPGSFGLVPMLDWTATQEVSIMPRKR